MFDDGANMSERTLVEIGDGATLNQGAMLQSHSLEEGAYKSDFVRIGAGATLGVSAFVHYGVTLGERTRLDPDAFLMKGEITPADSRWRGNPARLVGGAAAAGGGVTSELRVRLAARRRAVGRTRASGQATRRLSRSVRAARAAARQRRRPPRGARVRWRRSAAPPTPPCRARPAAFRLAAGFRRLARA